ncbi:MAG: acyl-CoA dehydratase activase [Pseudomonadota bacterium]
MTDRSMNSAGIDLGSVALKAVLLSGSGEVLRRLVEPVEGSMEEAIGRLLPPLFDGISGPVTFGVTGGGKARFSGLAGAHQETDLLATARAVAALHPEVRGVFEIGGHQSKWLRIGPGGRLESFALNEECAAGSGAFLEQQAGRLRMDIETLASMALDASRAASVAGRCAVFAKSDMIHLQQKGTPMGEIALGLCAALARNFRATLLRGSDLNLPVALAGGGALNPGLRRAFMEAFDLEEGQLVALTEPRHLPALGVAIAAAEAGVPCDPTEVLGWSGRGEGTSAGTLGIRLVASSIDLSEEPVIAPTSEVAAFLGVDVGSVSTDFTLLSEEGEVLDGIYLRTRGDPVGVIREGLGLLRERTRGHLRVLGVGTTGSGRHLAGSLLGADVVKNEITCQFIGARHVLPEVDTILEIGGQDSKFVSVRRGRIADFVMNKICAAGTGSFLEEQGETLGVSIREEFETLALASSAPASLGSQCTVFMDTEVVAARQRGVPLEDILAGLAVSVAKNYLERVVAGRVIGDHVVFQGGVASNRAVVAAFEALLGKRVVVHPFNRLSGAIGAAISARDTMGGHATRFLGLDAVESARVETFECRACSNLCTVSKIRVHERTSFFGDVCERFSATKTASRAGTLPDLTREVEGRLEAYAGGEAWLGVAGIPRASMMYDLFPFWATFLRSLGFRVVLPGASTSATLDAGVARLTAETCLPVKLVYGHVSKLLENPEVDFVFMPAIQDLPDGDSGVTYLCPFEESAGFMVGGLAGAKIVSPALHLAGPRERMARELLLALARWDVSLEDIQEGLEAGAMAQEQYEEGLRRRGAEILTGDFTSALVLLGKPYNITDAFENLNLSAHIRRLGLLAIPQQMIPFAQLGLKDTGVSFPWRYNRTQLQALLSLKEDERLFPVLISNFGCGPDAFSHKYFEEAAQSRPLLLLEFDEHRGEAGLVTRLEAFIDEIDAHVSKLERPAPRFPRDTAFAAEHYKGRRIVLPYFADHAYAYQGALRGIGLDAVVLPPPDEDTIRFGEGVSTGKECHPYVLLAGDLFKHLERGTIAPGDVYFFPGTSTPCLMHQYASSIRLEMKRRGVDGVELLNPSQSNYVEFLGFPGLMRLGRGLLGVELITRLHSQMRPYVEHPVELDARVRRAYTLLADFLAVDRQGDALAWLGKELDRFPVDRSSPRPLVGVAGDIYTRIHSFGNQGLFHRLEALGLEVWPAPFFVDSANFGFGREVDWGIEEGRYLDAAGSAVMALRGEWEMLFLRYHLGRSVERLAEPGYREVIQLASPYVERNANETVLLNVAKMVDFAQRGAHGVINAISSHCMLGTVSASLVDRIREDHDQIPMLTLIFSGTESATMEARLEAFAHQVHARAAITPPQVPRSGWRAWFDGVRTPE